jgi:hypothetical protein
MSILKIVIQKSNVADNAQPIGKNGKFICIAEMSVDVLLLCSGTGDSSLWHEAISHLMGLHSGIILVVGLKLLDKRIEGFGIVLSHIKFNPGSVKGKHIGKGRINGLAERLSEIDHKLEQPFDIREEILLEPCEERGIRDIGKATEIPKFFTEIEEKDEQGVGRNGQNFLKDKSRKKACKGVDSFTP